MNDYYINEMSRHHLEHETLAAFCRIAKNLEESNKFIQILHPEDSPQDDADTEQFEQSQIDAAYESCAELEQSLTAVDAQIALLKEQLRLSREQQAPPSPTQSPPLAIDAPSPNYVPPPLRTQPQTQPQSEPQASPSIEHFAPLTAAQKEHIIHH